MEKNQEQKHKVFVYGSLKKGFRNDFFLDTAQFLGVSTTKESNYKMISLGHFPAVYKDEESGGNINGELYLIDSETLNELDYLESNGVLYEREEILLQNNEIAWIYLFKMSIPSSFEDVTFKNVSKTLIGDVINYNWQ